MSHLVGIAELSNGCCGVATADDRGCVGFCHGFCNGVCAGCELRIFKNAHRTVPNDSLCGLDGLSKELLRLGADVKTFAVGGDCVAGAIFDVNVRVDRIGETCASCGVNGKINGLAELFCLCEHGVAIIDLFIVNERKTDAAALSFDEGVCHATADDERVAFVEKIVDDVELVGNFCAAENRNERTNGVFDCIAKEFELFSIRKPLTATGAKPYWTIPAVVA